MKRRTMKKRMSRYMRDGRIWYKRFKGRHDWWRLTGAARAVANGSGVYGYLQSELDRRGLRMWPGATVNAVTAEATK